MEDVSPRENILRSTGLFPPSRGQSIEYADRDRSAVCNYNQSDMRTGV